MHLDVTFPGGKKVDASFKGFTIETDQPEQAGGANSAPSPFDLFLASLATCAGYYVAAFCEGRGIDPKKIDLRMDIERDPSTKMIGALTIEVGLPPEFPEKYENAVIKAADQCAVKKHLEHPPKIEIVTVRR